MPIPGPNWSDSRRKFRTQSCNLPVTTKFLPLMHAAPSLSADFTRHGSWETESGIAKHTIFGACRSAYAFIAQRLIGEVPPIIFSSSGTAVFYQKLTLLSLLSSSSTLMRPAVTGGLLSRPTSFNPSNSIHNAHSTLYPRLNRPSIHGRTSLRERRRTGPVCSKRRLTGCGRNGVPAADTPCSFSKRSSSLPFISCPFCRVAMMKVVEYITFLRDSLIQKFERWAE